MKTAVSVPDDLFDRAEAAARRLRLSRSSLYAKAISEFLERAEAKRVTERINEVCAAEDAGMEPGLKRLQSETLRRRARW